MSEMVVERTLRFAREAKGKKVVAERESPVATTGKVPRIAKLMALAIHFDGLIREGKVRDYAELARLGGVSRARITQIMGLLNLSPKIQEELLFLPLLESGREQVTLKGLKGAMEEVEWGRQTVLTKMADQNPIGN